MNIDSVTPVGVVLPKKHNAAQMFPPKSSTRRTCEGVETGNFGWCKKRATVAPNFCNSCTSSNSIFNQDFVSTAKKGIYWRKTEEKINNSRRDGALRPTICPPEANESFFLVLQGRKGTILLADPVFCPCWGLIILKYGVLTFKVWQRIS